jgi:50S ribosomal subunit-associated GTPase HflX
MQYKFRRNSREKRSSKIDILIFKHIKVVALRNPLRIMPPKKEEVVKKVKLGRPGNTLKMGIVGLPNVGKSTTFNLLSSLNIPAENYPFCTIDPNLAKVFVDDERFNKLCDM